MNALEKSIVETRIGLLRKPNSGFFISSLLSLKTRESTETKTLKLTQVEDKTELHINPEWFCEMSIEQRMTALAHMAVHFSLQHDIRRNFRHPQLYQNACDQVTNNILAQMDFDMSNEPYDDKYRGLTVENVYEHMAREQRKDSGNGGSGGGGGSGNSGQSGNDFGNVPNTPSGNGNDLSDAVDQPSTSQSNQRNQQSLQAHKAAKDHSKFGDAFEKLFDEIKESKLDWKTRLHQFANQVVQGGLDYRQFNRRMIPLELYLPATQSDQQIEKITLDFDVSGSVSEEQIQAFLSQIQKIKNDLNPKVLEIITFNHGICEVITLKESDGVSQIKMRTGGGTDLDPVMDYNDENPPEFLIVFSDLYCDERDKTPPYPVIWVCIDNKDAKVNFGEIIHITSEELTS